MTFEANRILTMDAREGLRQLPDDSIDCCITSPPYWGLRHYKTEPQVWDGNPGCKHEWQDSFLPPTKNAVQGNTETTKNPRLASSQSSRSFYCSLCGAWCGELGLEPTFELYIKHLCDIFDEVWRVLKKRGTCWVNLADTYAGSWGGYSHDRGNESLNRRSYDDPLLRPPSSLKQNVKQKSLCLIPFRFAIEMCNRGWLLRNTVVWHKPNLMPQSARDRFTVDFEYVFFFTRSRRYYFEQQLEPLKAESIKRYAYSFEGSFTPGSAYPNEQRERPYSWKQNPLGRNKRCVWTVSTKGFSGAHYAVFPEALVEPMVRAGCPPQGLVLDPFLGSGTTAVVARKLGRNFIGIELNPAYAGMARERLKPYLEQKSFLDFNLV